MTDIPSAPATVDELRAMILARRLKLSSHAVRIIDLSIRRPDSVAFGTVVSLAHAVEVSPGTVLRALKSIGLHCFADFRDMFRAVVRARSAP